MKTAKRNSVIGGFYLSIALVATVAMMVAVVPIAQAQTPVVVTGNTDIKVWVEKPWNVYPSYDDVVITVHAARDCYLTVFLIDTYGFVHVVHPFSPYESAWVRGGMRYRFLGRDLGLGVLGGRGIAHVFAVGSPYPFDFTRYGSSIFVGGFGYRVYGDPYLACQELYTSIIPVAYWRSFAGFGFARFYVREWARYPMYLCYGYHGETVHVRTNGRCARCTRTYDQYRAHVNTPYMVIRSTPVKTGTTVSDNGRTGTRIHRASDGYKYKQAIERAKTKPITPGSARTTRIVSAKRTDITVKPVGKSQIKSARSVVTVKEKSDTRKVAVVAKSDSHPAAAKPTKPVVKAKQRVTKTKTAKRSGE